MNRLHRDLLAALRKRHRDFEPSPESRARLLETEKFARDLAHRGGVRFPLPDDYVAFLRELGRVPWPMDIGNILDFRSNQWPVGFVAFARDAKKAHGFLLRWRTTRISKDFERRAEDLEWRAAKARGEDRTRMFAEARALFEKAREADARREALAEKARTTNDLRIEAVSLAARALRRFAPDEEDHLDSFSLWLESAIATAEQAESTRAAVRTKKKVARAPAPAQQPANDSSQIDRALDLLDRLVAMEKIVVASDFDEDAIAPRLVPVLDDAVRVLDVLTDDPQIEEVFASADDVESLLR